MVKPGRAELSGSMTMAMAFKEDKLLLNEGVMWKLSAALGHVEGEYMMSNSCDVSL